MITSTYRMETAEDAKGHQEYHRTLVSLLYQLADDNFIMGYRGSEWLGLAPHIEADVAFSSIAQDHMGHAAFFYQLLDDLGEGKADDLAHLRDSQAFMNSILVERPNGSGDYIVNPEYDWGYAVTRQFVYDFFDQIRIQALKQSSYVPLAQVAEKISREKYYHVLHGEMWLKQMATTTTEARNKLLSALEKVWEDIDDLFTLGSYSLEMNSFHLIESAELLRHRFIEHSQKALLALNIPWPGDPKRPVKNGRLGDHTDGLKEALGNISEVYRQDPAANW